MIAALGVGSELRWIRLANISILAASWIAATVLNRDDFATSLLVSGAIVVANFEFSRVIVARAVHASAAPIPESGTIEGDVGLRSPETIPEGSVPLRQTGENASEVFSPVEVLGSPGEQAGESVATSPVSSSQGGGIGGYVVKVMLKSFFLLGLLTLLVLYGRMDIPGLLVGLSIPWLSITLQSVWRISGLHRASSIDRMEKS